MKNRIIPILIIFLGALSINFYACHDKGDIHAPAPPIITQEEQIIESGGGQAGDTNQDVDQGGDDVIIINDDAGDSGAGGAVLDEEDWDGDGVANDEDACPYDEFGSKDENENGICDYKDLDLIASPEQDNDGDGAPVFKEVNGELVLYDCNDANKTIYPGAEDKPDKYLKDTNCDGIDGDLKKAVWVSNVEGEGVDAGDVEAGSIEKPFNSIAAAIDAVEDENGDHFKKDIYVVGGAQASIYHEVLLVNKCEGIYGGFLGLINSGGVPKRLRSYGIEGMTTISNGIESFEDVFQMVPAITIKGEDIQTCSVAIDGFTIIGHQKKPAIKAVSANTIITNNFIRGSSGFGGDHAYGIMIENSDNGRSSEVRNNEIVVSAKIPSDPLAVVDFPTLGVFARNEGGVAFRLDVVGNEIRVSDAKKIVGVSTRGSGVTANIVGNIIKLSEVDDGEDVVHPQTVTGIKLGDIVASAKEVKVENNKILIMAGGSLYGIKASTVSEKSKIVNNAITLGIGDEQIVHGIDLKAYRGLVANNTIYLDSDFKAQFVRCGMRLEKMSQKETIVNNLFAGVKDWTAPIDGQIYGICEITNGFAKEVSNNFFYEAYKVLYYDKNSEQMLKDIPDLESIVVNAKDNMMDDPDVLAAQLYQDSDVKYVLRDEYCKSSIDIQKYKDCIKVCKELPVDEQEECFDDKKCEEGEFYPFQHRGQVLKSFFKGDIDRDERGDVWDIGADQCIVED